MAESVWKMRPECEAKCADVDLGLDEDVLAGVAEAFARRFSPCQREAFYAKAQSRLDAGDPMEAALKEGLWAAAMGTVIGEALEAVVAGEIPGVEI